MGDPQDARTAGAGTGGSHTPGPWRVQPIIGTYIGTEGDPYGHGPMHIADVRGWGHLTGQGACRLDEHAAIAIQTANARLIAAAPDLLEAVRAGGRYSDALMRYQEHGVRGQMIPGTDELERLFREWHDQGHAALEKAEGQPLPAPAVREEQP